MSTEQHNEGITNTTTTNPTTMESTARVEEIIARLCHIIKRADFDGYGFNLHSEKGKPGQYIGKVDSNSPAEYSGMREGDRILEVNGVNIGNETHKQVVQRIKAMADEVRLLLVDNGVEVTKNNEIVSKYVIRQTSSVPGNNNNNSQYETAVNNCDSNNLNKNTSTPSSPSISIKSDSNKSDIINNNNNNNMTPSSNNTVKVGPVQSNGQQKHTTNMDGLDSKTIPIIPVTNPVSPNSTTKPAAAVQPSDLPNISSLNLKMSAAEMRSRLKKKHDPKRDTVDLKSKYDIIQKL